MSMRDQWSFENAIRMSHWCHKMVDGTEFWITCKRPAFLSSFSRLLVIQNLAPSTMVWHQCDIRITAWTLAVQLEIPQILHSLFGNQQIICNMFTNRFHHMSIVHVFGKVTWEVSCHLHHHSGDFLFLLRNSCTYIL